MAAAHQLLGPGQPDMRKREVLVQRDRVGKGGVGARRRRQQAVDAAHVGVACRRRARAQRIAVAIVQHHPFSLPALASHSGAAIVSVKLENIKLNERLTRSVWPSLAGTLCLSHAGKISNRPSLHCASAALAVSRVYCRGLGMIIDGRGSWNRMREPAGGTAT